uniref:ABC transporter domain-containing protein n=1 Tax=Meloidogyne javanica TaxID=6303 RepID=A0A915LRN8_MELJA
MRSDSYYIVGYGFLSSLLYYGSHLISCGLLTYGDLSSFVIYAILCSANISNIRTFYSELMRGLGASSRLFELRDTKPKIPLSGGVCLTDLKEGIRFESVAFSYPDRDPIFNDITFKIPVGSTTAIVGSSGRILIDGQDMKNIDPSEWRKMCGVVSQEPVLFSATIKENILYGVPEGVEIGDEEIEKAAKLSNSLEFIRSFPQGFDTMVGEHGSSMLSGGQRQRIALARALIMKPRFIILDEATSALDATSEYLVRKSLEVLSKSGQTILIIAHRLSTIKHAEQIVVLDKGSVAEMGCFDDLMNIKDGIFQKLVEKQTLDWKFDRF